MSEQNNQLPNQQPQYYQPQQQPGYRQQAPVTSIGDWIVTSTILVIPLVNLVMAFMWDFRGNTSPSKTNYYRAWLIFIIVVVTFYALPSSFVLGTEAAPGRYN